jgi:hypothetical protein
MKMSYNNQYKKNLLQQNILACNFFIFHDILKKCLA